MKRLFTFCAMLVLTIAAGAADESKTSLLQLFNARLGENPKRFAEAVRSVSENAKEGQVLAQFAIALVARDADMPEEIARELTDEVIERYHANRSRIELAAKNKGNALAWYLLALDATNTATYVNCLKKATSLNNEQALNELGVYRVKVVQRELEEGYDALRQVQERGGSPDEVQAARRKTQGLRNRLTSVRRECAGYFNRAADRMDINGIYNLGRCLFFGYGCPRNEARAFEMLKSAAKEGQAQALSLLGECYRDGKVCPPDPVAAAALFKQSAELGNACGLLNYGLALLEGIGVDRDGQEAMVYLRKAADRHLPEAMNVYARCLMDGVGFVPINEKGLHGKELEEAKTKNAEAVAQRRHLAVAYWYHCANVYRLPAAMVQLGTCFRDGKGVEKRAAAAVYWYYRAAMDYDDAEAMFCLADCCELGFGGLTRSHDDANWWRTRAKAMGGDRLARIWLSTHDPNRFDQLILTPDSETRQEP